jgi:hypothetical protein
MIGFEPFKGRAAVVGRRTKIHRNLNRRDGVWWSITQGGCVVGHARGACLTNATPHVNPAAQARIASGGNRTVHAWTVGTLADDPRGWPLDEPIHYRPHQRAEFFDRHDTVWAGADTVVFNRHGMFA